ncbi:MAG TPA: ankyrin repeat domain-containing protein [Candidatus Limnocylindria bacterium]|nr:ankyrin repeat domain-containing protein [Candidatus Limnocylindria bacterium]
MPLPLPAALVREFVVAAHGNLDRTRELLGNEPGLLNATWDWKAGDFEAAIGGAGHMGRRDIALFLLGQGARMDLFVAAMLGELAIVKAYLTQYPSLATSKGPHGIPLIAHAKAGRESAAPVLEYLERLTRVSEH